MAHVLQELAQTGVAIWLDDLSREQIRSGKLGRMVETGESSGSRPIRRYSQRPSGPARATGSKFVIWR